MLTSGDPNNGVGAVNAAASPKSAHLLCEKTEQIVAFRADSLLGEDGGAGNYKGCKSVIGRTHILTGNYAKTPPKVGVLGWHAVHCRNQTESDLLIATPN
jgi:hypothetical protein